MVLKRKGHVAFSSCAFFGLWVAYSLIIAIYGNNYATEIILLSASEKKFFYFNNL